MSGLASIYPDTISYSFVVNEIVLSGIKSGPEKKFESLGCQKVDKKVYFSVENRPSF